MPGMTNASFLRCAATAWFAFVPMVLLVGVGCTQVGTKAHDLGEAFSGNYNTVANVSSSDAVAAAKQAVQDLHLIFISADKNSDDNATVVVARDAQDQRVTVTIVPQGSAVSTIVVSTGVFGNATLRQQVMDAVRARIGATTQPAAPATHPTSAPDHS